MDAETLKRITAERVADTCNQIEGVPISKYAQELSRQWILGQISSDEMIFSFVEHYRKNDIFPSLFSVSFEKRYFSTHALTY